MPNSIISFNYSEANILGWLFAREPQLPSYTQLLEVCSQLSLEQRQQSLRRWPLFAEVVDFSAADWVKRLLDREYDQLQQALPTRYGLDNHSFVTDVVWLERWMTPIRLIVREAYIGKDKQGDQEFVVEVFGKVLDLVPMPTDLQSVFLVSLQKTLNQPLTLLALEFALDRAQLGVQIRHLQAEKSAGIQNWILLQSALTWTQQYARAMSLHLAEPKWREWFPPEMTPPELESYQTLRDQLLRRFVGGAEWILPLELLDIQSVVSHDSVDLERRVKVCLSAYLNESLYSEDVFLQIMKYVYEIKLLAETAAVIVLPELLSKQQVEAVTANFDK